MSKFYLLFILSFFVISLSAEVSKSENPSEFLKKLEELLSKIPAKEIAELLINEKKMELLKILASVSDNNEDQAIKSDDDKNSENLLFQVRQPKPLTADELKKSARERINEKFIGKLPDRIDDMISYLEDPQEYSSVFNKILLAGIPGTGKTYLFNVLAQELQLPSLSFSAAVFSDKYVGEAARKIRKAFGIAKSLNKPVLIFIDEVDAIAAQRHSSTNNEDRRTLTMLLTELQDIHDDKNIFIICATNDLSSLDAAFKNRFSSKCSDKLLLLEKEDLKKLFEKLFKDNGLPEDPKLAQRLAEVVGAQHAKINENYIKYSTTSKDSFSNRELQDIVVASKFKKTKDCKDNKECTKPLCFYLRKAIDDTGKKAEYATYFGTYYCDGI